MIKFSTTLALAGCMMPSYMAKAQESRPNILFILVDDLGYADLSCQGSKEIRTPNIDRLAASGIRFTSAYVAAPQCSPSRAGIMSGVHPARFGYIDNLDHYGLPDPHILPIIPEYLKKTGYRTGIFGKWHIGQGTECLRTKQVNLPKHRRGKVRILSPKRREAAKPWKRGFDEGLILVGGSAHYFPFKEKVIQNTGPIYFTFNASDKEPRPAKLKANAYTTDFLTDAAIAFIRRQTRTPWFLYLSYTAPHGPLEAKQKDIEANRHIKDRKRRIFAGMMTCLDDNVGRILDQLDKQGIREQTLVVFLSDNGGPTKQTTSRNAPFSGEKGDVFEGGIRVPMIVSWPGTLAAGKVTSEPVISLDLLPTFTAVAGMEAKHPLLDGKNLLPWLTGKARNPHNTFFWSWRGIVNAVRIGTLKEIRNGKPVKAVDGTLIPAHNFVDLATNPKELGGEYSLQDENQKRRLSSTLDRWLDAVKRDAAKLTPREPAPAQTQ